MISIKKVIQKLSAHAIVEQGTSGGWNYRKNADGTAECWARFNIGSVAVTTKYNSIYTAALRTSNVFPANLFIAAPMAFVSPKGSGADFATAIASTVVEISFLWANATSYTAASAEYCVYAIGRWK